MPKPYIHWDPSINASLHVRQGESPLVVDADVNPEQFAFLVSKLCKAVTWGSDLIADYIQTMDVVQGSYPKNGIRVKSYKYMPYGLEFYTMGGASGQPYPQSRDDANNHTYMTLGYRASIRGYLGTRAQTHYASDLKVTWADRDIRNNGDSRGGYTGAILRNWGLAPTGTESTYNFFGCLHGKREVDSNWEYNSFAGVPAGVPGSASTTVLNGVDTDTLRIIIQGGIPASDILWQRYNGSTWIDLFSSNETLDYGSSLIWPYQGITADLFAGAVEVQPAVGAVWDDLETWFSRIEMTQFEPFVIDKSSWGYSEWVDHWAWLSPGLGYVIERRLPQRDLLHFSSEVPGGPTQLRVSDSDLGICMEFNELTYLMTIASWDQAGVSVTNTANPCVMDENEFGFQAPFAMLGRFRFQDMDLWSQSLPVDLFSAGRNWVSTGHICIYWEYTGGNADGKLVLRAWDSDASSYVTVEHEFNAADYDDVPVDIGFAWSGARGSVIGRPNYELRLVIDGQTVDSVVNHDIRVTASNNIFVGSPRATSSSADRRAFSGLFREMMVFGDPMTDQDMRNAWRDTSGLDNYSFETAALTNRPGEADGWTWDSFQQVGAWSGFNEYRSSLIEWATSFEHFSAGWYMPHVWAYDDESTRTGASGMIADDVGGVAWQMDNDTLWLLINHSPVTWEKIEIGTNEDWLDDSSSYEPGLFNPGVPLYETLTEEFGIWDFSIEAGELIGTIILPPWTEKTTISPHEDTFRNASGGTIPIDLPTGFRGWKDAVTGAMEYPLETDEFGEAWSTDPLSTAAGPVWIPGTCVGGVLRGRALTLPVNIIPDRRFLTIWSDASQINILELDTGQYNDAAALASMIDAKLVAQNGVHTGWGFSSWDDGEDEGILFGWNGDESVRYAFLGMFGVRALAKHNDARFDIGLDSVGPGGVSSKVIMPANEVVFLPGGVTVDEEFWLDPWSLVWFTMTSDPYCSSAVILDYQRDPVLFGTMESSPDATMFERFTLVGWFGPSAAWVSSWSGAYAMFDGANRNIEEFITANWPDHY